jgi:hypothetical protein
MTDAGPVSVLGDLPFAGGPRTCDEMMDRAVARSVHDIDVRLE